MMFKAILVTSIPIIVIVALYLAPRPKPSVKTIEPDWHNAEIIGDGASPWRGKIEARVPREHEPRGM